ncbi:Guanine deaminase [Pseudobythopirellula maris]|uniref:Guanine deaminase n=1 Tax=Pseudobythopirellula maris TaxID=2527991 RepID=A0A5C5ZRN0_9BACT|nr:amidohydrolase family protein [Pseudobythopirellula maris]TWT90169.1 Guanine deaminase [Pseudobythopirellula maris]
MILAGQLLLNDDPCAARIAPGYVRVEGDTIAEVVVGEVPASADAGGPHALVSPGLVDAHLHLPQFDTMGAHGLPLLEWLEGATFPAERRWEDPDFARSMTQRVVDQLFAHGTTAVCAYATVHHEGALAALETAAERGLRGVIGQVLMDREAPGFLCRDAEESIAGTARLLDLFPPGGRLAAAVTPRFAITCTPELLAQAGGLAAERNATVQTHLAETVAECQFVERLFGEASYTQVYDQAGLLTPRSVMGHGIHLSDEDRRLLKDRGSIIAHCPTANSFLRSGAMDRRALLGAECPMVLGSDIGAGYERSMVRVARAMVETASALGEGYPSAAEAWRQITAGTSETLGWSDAGFLKPGAPADLLLVEPDIDWLGGRVDPLAMLLFAWDDRWLRRTYARGELVYGSDAS